MSRFYLIISFLPTVYFFPQFHENSPISFKQTNKPVTVKTSPNQPVVDAVPSCSDAVVVFSLLSMLYFKPFPSIIVYCNVIWLWTVMERWRLCAQSWKELYEYLNSISTFLVGCWCGYLSRARCRLQPSWCHCHSLSLAPVKSRLVLPFWYRLTWVVLEKGQLNVCVCVY